MRVVRGAPTGAGWRVQVSGMGFELGPQEARKQGVGMLNSANDLRNEELDRMDISMS